MIKLITGKSKPCSTLYIIPIWVFLALAVSGCDGGIFGTGDGDSSVGVVTPDTPVDGVEPEPTPTPDPAPAPTPDPTNPPGTETPPTGPVTTPTPGDNDPSTISETADVVFNNNVAETTRPDALLRFVLANPALEDNIVVTNNGNVSDPLLPLPGLSFLDGVVTYRSVPAATDHNIQMFLAEDIRAGNAVPFISVNPLDVSAGSITTLLLRGGASPTSITVDILPAKTQATPENNSSQLRIIHGAFAYAGNGAVDVYLVSQGDSIAQAISSTSAMSYTDAPITDYADVPPGQYNLIVTQTGQTEAQFLIDRQIDLTSEQVLTIVIRDDPGVSPGEAIDILTIEDSLIVVD